MNKLFSTARNLRFATDGEKVIPLIEAVLTTKCRQLSFLGTSVGQTDVLETVRIEMTDEAARTLAADLIDWAEEAEEIAGRIAVTTKEEQS